MGSNILLLEGLTYSRTRLFLQRVGRLFCGEAVSSALYSILLILAFGLKAMLTGFTPAQNKAGEDVEPGSICLIYGPGKQAAVLGISKEVLEDVEGQFMVQDSKGNGRDDIDNEIYEELQSRLLEGYSLIITCFHSLETGRRAAADTLFPDGREAMGRIDGYIQELASFWPGKIIITALPSSSRTEGLALRSEDLFVPYMLLAKLKTWVPSPLEMQHLFMTGLALSGAEANNCWRWCMKALVTDRLKNCLSRFSIYDLLIIAVMAALGIVLKPFIATLARLVVGPLMIPGGAVAGGLYMLWLVLALALTGKYGASTLVGLVQALVIMFSGSIGSHGVMTLVSYTLPGVALDLGLFLLQHTVCCPGCAFLAGLIANVTGTFIVNFIFFRLPGLFLCLILALAALSGGLGGLLAWQLLKLLKKFHLIQPWGKASLECGGRL